LNKRESRKLEGAAKGSMTLKDRAGEVGARRKRARGQSEDEDEFIGLENSKGRGMIPRRNTRHGGSTEKRTRKTQPQEVPRFLERGSKPGAKREGTSRNAQEKRARKAVGGRKGEGGKRKEI